MDVLGYPSLYLSFYNGDKVARLVYYCPPFHKFSGSKRKNNNKIKNKKSSLRLLKRRAKIPQTGNFTTFG